MSHIKTKVSRIGNRLVKSAASSALALSAIAGGIMVSGQSASAIPVCPPSPEFVGPPRPLDPGLSQVTIYCGPQDPAFAKVELQNPLKDLYDVDYDYTPDLTSENPDPGPYIFKYLLTSNKDPFIKAQLDSNVTRVSGPDITITKQIFADEATYLAGGPTLLTLVSTNGSQTGFQSFGPAGSIYVIDTVVIPDGTSGVVDNYRNSYQTPGPLPILGAGAAFGFSRKLRSRIKANRLA